MVDLKRVKSGEVSELSAFSVFELSENNLDKESSMAWLREVRQRIFEAWPGYSL